MVWIFECMLLVDSRNGWRGIDIENGEGLMAARVATLMLAVGRNANLKPKGLGFEFQRR
jgi:hypothetical protein